ncbi:NUDIX domain-containing protein [Rhodococcus rhodnii]|uniref:Nudix hydrolase domain-containing protein n=2 Tax=Rhodococcus rhodnii TaxID=38312 RepID=R7WQP4_9NOCA|nr:NUDIX domain-containing protein [Rhodococcus rhodnii]EOM76289.1 hypothetical protein Rrhod_2389 [Rhodococcus rhodnii LMG 5362]TXG90754.1 NUDIX domain-containing protein [Rhodococcus rhodnii]
MSPVKDASTVVLLRDGDGGPEVFLLRRAAGMEFAGGMTVFPGGGVDATDAEADIAWVGPDVSWWARRYGVDEPRAQALVCAAVRETFEECGVLLAGHTESSTVDDTRPFADDRRALERRELSFAQFLTRHDLVLRSDLLRPWANWITPVGERRRYDTRFFVAAVPEGQIADGETSEADDVRWSTAGDALETWRAGETVLLPPTWRQLRDLTEFGAVEDVLAQDRAVEPIMPTLVGEPGAIRVDFPDQDEYYSAVTHPWAAR